MLNEAPAMDVISEDPESGPAYARIGRAIRFLSENYAAQPSLDEAASIAALSPYTEKFQKGSTTYHRARFAGISSAKAANDACTALKRQKFNCFDIAPQS